MQKYDHLWMSIGHEMMRNPPSIWMSPPWASTPPPPYALQLRWRTSHAKPSETPTTLNRHSIHELETRVVAI